jgi:hypothetical protein
MTHAREPIRIVDKGWRREIWIANGELYCGKILEIGKGNKCSLHYHEIQRESFYLRSGRIWVRLVTPGMRQIPRFRRSLNFRPDSA